MLEIKNLHARIAEDGTEIIRGLNLTVKAGEVAAIMGPNGSGKSTLSYILSGREDYEVTEGDILYNGESILSSMHRSELRRASSSPSSIRSKFRASPPCSS